MRKRIIGAFCMTALASGAAEPVWPTDFAEQVAANIAAAQPYGTQIGLLLEPVAVELHNCDSSVSAGNGTVAEPLDSIRYIRQMSDFHSLDTRKHSGMCIIFR